MVWFELPHSFVIRVSGRDALRYLHARLSNDIRNLAVGAGCFAAALSAQGKPDALFAVYRLEEGEFLLVIDGGDPTSILTSLRQFVVTEQIETVLETHLTCFHSSELPSVLIDPEFLVEPSPGLSVQRGPDGAFLCGRVRTTTPGFDLIVPEKQRDPVLEFFHSREVSALSEDEQLVQRVKSGTPVFPTELLASRILLESVSGKTAASFTKGCYVGQEVLEKIDSHGRAPRKLVGFKLEGTKPCRPGEKVFTRGDGEKVSAGEVIDSAPHAQEKSVFGFAYLKRAAAGKLEADGREFTIVSEPIHLGIGEREKSQ